MRIGYINAFYHPTQTGGAERSVQILAENIRSLGQQVSVLTTTLDGSSKTDEVNGVPVTYLRQKNIYSWPAPNPGPIKRLAWHLIDSYNPLMQADVARWLDVFQPDLIHTNTLQGISVAAWSAARRRGVRIVHTLRDYYLLCPKTTLFKNGANCEGQCVSCRLLTTARKLSSNQVDAVTGVSRFTLDRHLRVGYFEGVPIRQTIYNPMPIIQRPCTEPNQQNIFRLGFIGKLDESKGILFLLEAVSKLPSTTYKIYIAGRGRPEYESELRQRFSNLPIEWLGHIPPGEFFPKIDLLVTPSLWHEPFGRVIAESFDHGVPVVATMRGGIPELIDEGQTGFLFEPTSPGDLASLLQGLNAQRCQSMREACLEKAREFAPQQIAKQYLAIYENLIH